MKVTLKINFKTVWGQSLAVYGSITELGNWDKEKAVYLFHLGNGDWIGEFDIPAEESFEYRYLIKKDGHIVGEEWGQNHYQSLSKGDSNVIVYDNWSTIPNNMQYFSSAFTECLFKHEKIKEPKNYKQNLCLKLWAPQIRSNQSIGIIGGHEVIGNWDETNVLLLNPNRFPEWNINLNLAKIKETFEYKFVIVDNNSKSIVSYEGGGNRYFDGGLIKPSESITMACAFFIDHQLPWKGAGFAIPLFSIRTENSFGIGDFSDLKLMVDWATKTSQKLIQILPINDTTMTHTWVDSYPYNANSIFALHPNYANINKMGSLKDSKKCAYFEEKRLALNALKEVDYDAVTKYKWEYFHLIYEQDGSKTLDSADFKRFFEENKEWLVNYAAFCYLRDENKSPVFGNWKKHSVYNASEIAKLVAPNNPHYDKIAIHYFIQYHLDKQLKESKIYADEKKIAFKGDIPIGISPNSVEAWAEPHLFNMNAQAGAPPDDFSATGQNWGFPTYNWEEMAKDGYLWWRKRFAKMATYFNAYRIDHILGFFRIWEIPKDSVQGLLGHFNPALPFSHHDLELRGFHFNYERHARPFIRHYMLIEIFGVYVDEVIEHFLSSSVWEVYHLKPEFDTQLKVEKHFEGNISDKDIWIRDGLYGLINEVLFVEDPQHHGRFHPRIAAHFTYSYRNMGEYDRWKYDHLYIDFFYHRHNHFWGEQAMHKLPALVNSTNMLCCAEDLGMIPDCVPAVMHNMQILSLEIQRMPKDSKVQFGNTYHYPYLSVCTTSTHDMSTNRGWWEENRILAQNFFNNILHEWGEAPYYCEPWIAERILTHHLNSPSMLSIFPLQDLLAIDEEVRRDNPQEEQINVPANPKHYWRYRMHLTVEELLKADVFNSKLKKMIQESGRDSAN